jgi:hypothetical protein
MLIPTVAFVTISVVHYKRSLALTVRFYVTVQVLGLGEGRTFIASETSAFSRYTKNFIAMKDGEIGVVHASGTTLDISRLQV